MYAIVKGFLDRLGSAEGEEIRYSASETRIAMGVLLYRMMIADGRVHEAELARYRELLREKLNVSLDELSLFEEQVENESDSEISLFPFTSIVNKLPVETKREILAMMRDISVSDNELHEVEINLVTRTAQLLNLSAED